MPYKLLICLTLILFFIGCNKDENPILNDPGDESPSNFAVDVGDSEVPYIIISTDSEVQNEPKIPATMEVYQNGELVQSENIGIEYRGSTSYRLSAKKSYGIEVWNTAGEDTNASFFGFPEEEDWILGGHIVSSDGSWILDRTMIYHYLAYNLYRQMGNYGSRTQLVEVQINGEYMGVYVFMEKLKRDKNRVDIADLEPTDTDSTGGYILKIDKTSGGDLGLDNQPLEYFDNNWADDATYTEEFSFRSDYDINRQLLDFEPYRAPYHALQYLETYFLYEYPKASVITDPQKQYIQEYIHDFETALLNDDFSTDNRTYTDYIDLDSFVDFFIINELCRNIDGYRLSTYMYKDKGEKLKMGPVWDFNIGFDTGDRIPWDDWVINYASYVPQDAWMTPFWWPRLMEDPVFRESVNIRWMELRSGALSNLSILNLVDESAGYLFKNRANFRNYDKWDPRGTVDYTGSINDLKDYLNFRLEWMDGEIVGF